ncbi:ammonia-forming cytochrome c nitrite reductase subunit c552 [Dethiobacter alkaliphilus]|uniref:ammonia-forming cytochrome c nitrite reductase subunit c552 n=1 Tax=Dethiobacter alkaliphilus TaxID=427926 RepID=UPI0022274263|nr:ammonia-forming cytochrome c nitrite reductase subunit c552 [Dethiobacter alkaliphilus]MCW3489878.1 ammonia-forming cytochrome c nitrite reductase subunit c552 [Dethiobacter alkaliphilus]
MGNRIAVAILFLLLSAAPAFAQGENCAQCHDDVAAPYQQGPHSEMDCSRCHENSEAHAASPAEAPGVSVVAENCGECHELQYNSYVTGEDADQTPQKQEKFPLLRRLLAGHPFAEDYREPRSHINMLTDFVETSRPRSALCMFCKSSDVYWQWQDTISYESNTGELLDQGIIVNPITCVQCHNPHTTELRMVQPALTEALERMPDDHPGQEDPLQTQVCGQCHVNYNFNPAAQSVEFPFVKVAEMPDYIASTDIWRETGTGGWEHPDAGSMLYKVQHPETELYWDSIHHNLGVSCADCHMPQITENGQTFTQHWLTSPLNHLEPSCLGCHNESVEELEARVREVQETAYSLNQTVMSTMDGALDSLAAAGEAAGVNEDTLAEARENYFQAHLFWEWFAAENSVGFHNSAEAQETLERALAYAEDARDLAVAAQDGRAPNGAPPADDVPAEDRFPVLPFLVGLAIVAGAIIYFIKRR